MNNSNEIHFDCPKCKRPMSGDRALLGEMINCPDCNEPFMPQPRKAAPAPAPAPVAAPVPRLTQCPACGHNVSSQAASCPGCGQPMAAAGAQAGKAGMGAGMIIWPVILLALVGAGTMGMLPWIYTVVAVVLCVLGAVVTQFSGRPAK